MADDPATFRERERAMLREMIALIAERSSAEESWRAMGEEASSAAERTLKETTTRAERREQAERTAAFAEHEARAGDLGARFKAADESARQAKEAELASFAERTRAIEAAARQDLDDSSWLADTVVESSERKLQNDHAATVKQVAALEADLDEIDREGRALTGKRAGSAPQPDSTPAPGEPTEPGDAAKAAEGARDRAVEALVALRSAVKPEFLRPAAVLAVVLTSGAIGSVVAAWRFADQWTFRNASLAALAGMVVAALALVAGALMARRRIPAAMASFASARDGSRAGAARWNAAVEAERLAQLERIRRRRDEELRKAKDRFAIVRAEVVQRKRVEEPAIRQRHDEALADLRRRHDASVAQAAEAHARRLALAQQTREHDVEGARASGRALVDGARGRIALARDALARRWSDAISRARARVDELAGAASRLCPAWDEDSWASLRPALAVPPAVRFGTLEVDLSSLPGARTVDAAFAPLPEGVTPIPAMLDLFDGGSMLIQTGADGREQAGRVVENVLLRLLCAFPPGKVRFTIVDPVGLGQSFAGFMHLSDYEEALVGDKIWTDPRRIEQKLQDLTDHMENVIQKYLRNEFATIQDYNREAGEVAEPYRFLVIADLPAGISEAAAKRLESIASSGKRCGVYTLIIADTRQRPPAWLPVQALERSSVVLSWQGGRFVCQDEDFARWPLTLEAPPRDEAFTRLIHAIGRHAKDSSKVQVPFDVVAPQASQRWSLDAGEELRVPVGRAGATKLQHVTLGRGTSQHLLIAGRTGSGKSTLLHALITNLGLWYAPGEVEFYLVDFKKGVEFKTYATHQVPHARVVAVESEREFGLSVLRRLDAELTRRGSLFRDAGVQDLAGYRRYARGAGLSKVPASMPRILLIVDEFQEFFVEDDKLAGEASLLLDRLVRQGRAFGMHVVLGSQTVGGAYSLARSTIGQMAVRIALQCSEADSYLILSEDNPAARLLSRPGEAIYNDASGMVEGNSPFQIVWLPEEKREECLRQVAELASRSGVHAPAPIVFEGNVPSDLARNQALDDLLAGRAQPAAPTAWLGEAISIKDPTGVAFRRQTGSNLVIVGQHEGAAQAIILAALTGLAAFHARAHQPARFVLLDPGTLDDGTPTPLADLGAALGPDAELATPRACDASIERLSAELDRRRAGDATDDPRVYLVVNGMHRFRSLRRADEFSFSSEGDAPATTDQRFARLVREGPALGIHAIAWCDTVPNLERCVERRALREFDHKVALQMSGQDSTNFIDSPQAVNLGRHRALYLSEELGQFEKFRPYAMPAPEWLADAVARLTSLRAGA